MKNSILLLLCLVGISLKGQNIFEELQSNDSGKAKIIIYQDENIKTLLLARINEINKIHKIPGFRINIFYDDSQNSYEKAMQVRGQFLAKFNYNCDYIYEAPDSKLYIGNFRTISEAQKALIQLKQNYPKAFIKPDYIDLPDIE